MRACWRAPLVGALAVAVLVAGGCGDDDETTGATTTAAAPSSTVATTTKAPTTTAPTTTITTTTTVPATTTTVDVATTTVLVYFSSGTGEDCAEVTAFERPVPTADDPVTAAFSALVAGPTAEEQAAGEVGSFFSEATADTLRSVRLEGGLLVVDFRDLRPLITNASTSCGSEALLAQLTATAFQFEEVERARFEIDGSCDVFSNWLQRECTEYTRDGARAADLSLDERALGSGCSPGDWPLPDGRWFGFVDEASEVEVTFDLACWFSGEAAAEAAAEDGEESPPPNDFHIRNANELLREESFAGGARAEWMTNPSDPATTTTGTYLDWLAARTDRPFQPGVWLEVVDGEVVALEEQYVP